MKLKLLLTFDHEVPLGGVRTSYKEAMFDSTDRLFALAEKLDISIVLFTDVLCAMRFEEWDNKNFYLPYVSQLQNAIHKNHDVQLHLHPHWLTTTFNGTTFVPSKDYRLADFKNNREYNINEIIKSGKNFLTGICMEAAQNYKCIAYRAGGFNIERETKEIFNSLYSNGIRFDSSIGKGYYFRSALSEINCNNMPDVPNWFIGQSGNIRVKASEGILEVPLATKPKTPFEMPTRFKLKTLASRAPRDHGFQIHEGNPTNFLSKIKMMFSARMLSFDNYTLSVNYLMNILDYNVRKYKHFDNVVLATLGHPKTMGDYSFYLMESFVNNVRKKYPDAEFTTFAKLAEEMKI
ncbi:MAG TPA: hypothetical protein VFU62_03725 [Hanamia sp.]|nr:hypothetical protein [Hanamia sp.]